MKLSDIYKKYPTTESCIKFLEFLIWEERPVCPYCNSSNQSPLPKENRYHCNTCKTTFSITVNTVFHKSRTDLQKWFMLIWLFYNSKEKLTVREIAIAINVAKDTAWLMLQKLTNANPHQIDDLNKISTSL